MARNPKLEAILAARWEAEGCTPAEKAPKLAIVKQLVEQALVKARSDTAHWRELLAATESEYRDFRAERLKEQARRLSRMR
ncbi:MAG: hypothetical protein FJ403_06525 [Verrucomicrobia bacterium]|nr:hypothetical protein [Verrucomicrobiota bacterium]